MRFRLIESKEDQQKFIDKFGKDAYDNFVRLKDRIKKFSSVDLTFHVKNTNPEDMGKIIDRAENREYEVGERVELDIEGKPIPKPTKTYKTVYKGNDGVIYFVTDVEDMIELSKNTYGNDWGRWCIAGRYNMSEDGKVKVSQARQYFPQYMSSQRLNGYYVLINANGDKACLLIDSGDKDIESIWNSRDTNINATKEMRIKFSSLIMELLMQGLLVYKLPRLFSEICGESQSLTREWLEYIPKRQLSYYQFKELVDYLGFEFFTNPEYAEEYYGVLYLDRLMIQSRIMKAYMDESKLSQNDIDRLFKYSAKTSDTPTETAGGMFTLVGDRLFNDILYKSTYSPLLSDIPVLTDCLGSSLMKSESLTNFVCDKINRFIWDNEPLSGFLPVKNFFNISEPVAKAILRNDDDLLKTILRRYLTAYHIGNIYDEDYYPESITDLMVKYDLNINNVAQTTKDAYIDLLVEKQAPKIKEDFWAQLNKAPSWIHYDKDKSPTDAIYYTVTSDGGKKVFGKEQLPYFVIEVQNCMEKGGMSSDDILDTSIMRAINLYIANHFGQFNYDTIIKEYDVIDKNELFDGVVKGLNNQFKERKKVIDQFSKSPIELVDKKEFKEFLNTVPVKTLDESNDFDSVYILPDGRYVLSYDGFSNSSFEIYCQVAPSYIVPEDPDIYDKYNSDFIDQFIVDMKWIYGSVFDEYIWVDSKPTKEQMQSIFNWIEKLKLSEEERHSMCIFLQTHTINLYDILQENGWKEKLTGIINNYFDQKENQK